MWRMRTIFNSGVAGDYFEINSKRAEIVNPYTMPACQEA